ncbi:MAG: ArgE/DapE family deacylase [Nitrolancea sp.]
MIQLDRAQLATTLSELVRINSVNPDLVPGAAGEKEIAYFIAGRLRRSPGISVELQEVEPNRPNVIASVGSGTGRTLMLNGHIDTVTLEGMPEPLSGRIESAKLYGRGANDMKSSIAAMIVLLEAIATAGDFPGRLVATFVVDEEYASIGTQAVCREIDRWKPDAALILEPTGLEVTVAHKGFVWAAIETHGFAAHGSAWREGVDAIAHMGRVLGKLEGLRDDLQSQEGHPLLGPPSLHASLIRGGQELSSYPASCHLEIERRTIPGESLQQVTDELRSIIDVLQREDPQFSATLTMGLDRQPFEISPDAPIVQAIRSASERVLGRIPEIVGASGWMDSALLSAVGVPTTIYGPGGFGSHGYEEWADLGTLYDFARVLEQTAYDFCGAG